MEKNEAIKYIRFCMMDGRWVNGQIPRNFIVDEKWQAGELAIKALESSSWIPVTTRELTDEEKDENPEITFMWSCPLPNDRQDVLVTTSWGDVRIVTFFVDDIGSYFDDCSMGKDDVLAWMPLPKPYTKEEQS